MAAAAFLSARAAPALLHPSRRLSRCLVVSRAAAAAASASSSFRGGGGEGRRRDEWGIISLDDAELPCSPLVSDWAAFAGGGGVGFQGKVGFLGLGIMGAPMASNLINAGCDVTVWNRTKSKCDPLLSVGAKYEPSPAQVASSCDVTFAMLADPQSAAEVACRSSGAAEGLAPEKGYVDVSTVDGATSKLIAERITSSGASFLEAPVSGSKKPAEDGLLIFLTAGDESLYKRVAPLLDVMGKVISQGAISAPMFSLKGPSMVKAAYATAFPLKHQQKDMRLALALAESVSQSIPTVAAANELYKAAKSLGLSDHDFSAVIEALKAKVQSSQQ
ncbi:unnamed protein product [Miscanthus lutarioriparius]|uniref:6-phosphogluconate dehydrogenase NADP-binding domain-containing protein n=1 Tax=Miscanthus lutarioriparius TaxID=422564 RepID=A0A811P0Q7_9POAL|nr:unnamed protein product [Miscanthus lutarioriparius]